MGERPQPLPARRGTSDHDAQTLWSKCISGALNKIFYDPNQGITKQEYIQIQTNIRNFCGNVNVVAHRSCLGSANSDLHNNVAKMLYDQICSYISIYVGSVSDLGFNHRGPEEILRFYKFNVERFLWAAQIVNGICRPLNGVWLTSPSNTDKLEMYQLALLKWHAIIFAKFGKEVTNASFNIIQSSRDNEGTGGIGEIKYVVRSLVEMGVAVAQKNKVAAGGEEGQQDEKLNMYQEAFEKPYLEQSRTFFEVEAQNMGEWDNPSECLVNVEKRMDEELSGSQCIFHSSTYPKALQICQEVYVEPRIPILCEAMGNFLKKNKDEDLARLYKVLRNGGSETTLQVISEAFSKFVVDHENTNIQALGNNAAQNVIAFVDLMIQASNKYRGVVEKQFQSDNLFMGTLELALNSVLNKNSISEECSTRPAEFLARYSDRVLKNKLGKTKLIESQVQAKLKDLLQIVEYLKDKDGFQKYFTHLLANRLLDQSTASDDWEDFFIERLKLRYGKTFVDKWGVMKKDIELSHELAQKYKNDLPVRKPQGLPYDISPTVLSGTKWPFRPDVVESFVLPTELLAAQIDFNDYYKTQYPCRQLDWLPWKGKGELNFKPSGQKKYVFVASGFQIAILLLFNEERELSVLKIAESLKTPDDGIETLKGVLSQLLKLKLFTSNLKGGEELTENTILEINLGYKNIKTKVNINGPVRNAPQAKREAAKIDEEIVSGRKTLILAAIVRTMKTRQRATTIQIQDEVLNIVRASFMPTPQQIQEGIEQAIAGEYMTQEFANGNDNPPMYIYTA